MIEPATALQNWARWAVDNGIKDQDMEHKKFGEMSREEKLELLVAWIDGKRIECFLRERACDDSAWHPVHAPRWEPELCYRIASVPIVKPSINWDHVAEKFIALAVDNNGRWHIYTAIPYLVEGDNYFHSNRGTGRADFFASFCPGSFFPKNGGDIENWQDSLVFRPGHEPKGGMMEQDRELLELAAQTCGVEFDLRTNEFWAIAEDGRSRRWNPINDDGDALRLAVKLGLVLNLSPRQDGRGQTVVTYHGSCKIEEPCYDGEGAAARRAIVRAAAEIGWRMKEQS